jgi:tetratricopeptide (TPR) repeat protein
MRFVFARIWQGRRDAWLQRAPALSPALFAIGQTLALSCVVLAAQPTEEFVKGLQERGLHELSLEYLDRLKSSPLVDEATRKQIPYLRGVALVEQSRQTTDAAARNRLLDEARTELEQFAEANPQSVLSAESQTQLGMVQMGRGQEFVAEAASLPKESAYDAQRESLNREARVRFAEARETFQRAEATYTKELEKLPPTLSNEASDDTGSKRQQYRGRVAQLRYLASQSQFELARTYSPDADEFKKLNRSAADELATLYEEFGRSGNTVGLYAHLAEGRCYQAIGEYAMALGCYEDILRQPNVLEPFRKLIAAALHRKAEVLIAQEKYDLAIDACNACLKDARNEEERESEWLAVRYRLAEALAKKAETVASNAMQQRKLQAEARDAYRFVARFPGELQVAARTAAASAEGAGPAEAGRRDEPTTFQAAYDLGKDALASYNAAKLATPSAEKNNPAAVPQLQAQMDRGKADARHYFGVASTLVEVDTDPALLNEVRYFLCWLYWEAEDFYRAAVLGEFLARRFPDHPAASSAAKISMAAFERLYNQALASGSKKNDGDFEARHMAQLAEFIVRRWPGTEDADAAFGVLVSIAIRTGRTDDAERLLGQASKQSRPRLELLLGNALWGRYLELSKTDAESPAGAESLSKLKASAIKYLQSGGNTASKEMSVSDSGVTAALYLVQALLSDGEYSEAIRRLEEKETGLLTLITKKHPTASKPAYAIEAYKAALRAYVSVTPPQDKKAVAAMQSLEKLVTSNNADGKAAEQLMRIYISMGVALQKQLEELQSAGKREEATRVAGAFAKFLDRIGAEQAEADWPTRVWLAQMYYSLGTGDQSDPAGNGTRSAPIATADKSAREHLNKSLIAYQKLLDEVAKDPKLAPSESAVLAVKMQLGECFRALGRYGDALDTFSDILRDKEASLAVQRAAALAYQERGQREDAQWLERAIHGGYKVKATGRNRIWGWLRISQVAGRAAQSDPKFWDSFFEARFNLSKCRYLAAIKQSGDERQQDLARARQSIQSLAQLYPKLGGEQWKPQFDRLTRDIQREEAKNLRAGS